jgi:glycosyltransferase involved in cell wall biosynthesis
MIEAIATSVIIPWKDRPELRRCLEENLRFYPPGRCEVIVVNCGGSAESLGALLAGLPANIRPVRARHHGFNKCFAQNVGAWAAVGEMLLLLDADVVLESDLPELAMEVVGPDGFMTVASVRESDAPNPREGEAAIEVAYQLEMTVAHGRVIRLETNRTQPLACVRSGPGLLAVRRRHYLAVGGANSALRGWGWEDLDLIARLQIELGLARVQAGSVLHLSHPDSARILQGRSRPESEQDNFMTCLANYAAGLFQGTYARDIESLGDAE